MEKKDFRNTEKQGIFLVDFPEEVFPSAWIESTVPIIFDFKGLETIGKINNIRNQLYCLLPLRYGRYAILAEISHKAFINTTNNGEWSSRVRNFIVNVIRIKQEQQNQKTTRQQPKI